MAVSRMASQRGHCHATMRMMRGERGVSEPIDWGQPTDLEIRANKTLDTGAFSRFFQNEALTVA